MLTQHRIVRDRIRGRVKGFEALLVRLAQENGAHTFNAHYVAALLFSRKGTAVVVFGGLSVVALSWYRSRLGRALKLRYGTGLAMWMGALRPWYRPALLACDWLYRTIHGLNRPTSEVGPILRIEIRRSHQSRTLPDGERLRAGDRIAVLHLNNARVAALRDAACCPRALGFEMRRQLYASLGALAGFARPGGPLSDVRAFTATTVFHGPLVRLGFHRESDGRLYPVLVAIYQRALLASFHPRGSRRLRRGVGYRADRVWLSREELCRRWGQSWRADTAPRLEGLN